VVTDRERERRRLDALDLWTLARLRSAEGLGGWRIERRDAVELQAAAELRQVEDAAILARRRTRKRAGGNCNRVLGCVHDGKG
jgi:hypothetical protein